MMGYGLTDIQTDDEGNITDSRINPDGYLLLNCETQEEQFYVKEFREIIRQAIHNGNTGDDLLIYLNYIKEKHELWDCIEYDSEFGLSNVLCIIPPTQFATWKRYDDTIDYTMANMGIFLSPPDNPCEPWAKVYHAPFYPYLGWDDSKTGEMVVGIRDGIIRECIRRVWHNSPVSIWYGDENVVLPNQWQEILECVTTGDVLHRYIPSIPASVKELVKYTKLFTDESTVYQLRPIMYCYWS